MCGLGGWPSLSCVPFFPESSHLSPGLGVLATQTTSFCSCRPKNEAPVRFPAVCFPAGLSRIKAANHQQGPQTRLSQQRKPCKMQEARSKLKSEASRSPCILCTSRRLSVCTCKCMSSTHYVIVSYLTLIAANLFVFIYMLLFKKK